MPQTVAIVPQRRSIGNIVAQVTIRESYRNDMEITEHPVENGAQISDHAYLRPRVVELEIGWDGTHNPADVFAQLKNLQATRNPVTIYTDRDVLPNMLVAGIATVTDQRTAYSFIAIVQLRQVNLVSTQSTTISSGFAGSAASALPETTTSYVDNGAESLMDGTHLNQKSPTWQSLSATDDDIKAALGGTPSRPTVPLGGGELFPTPPTPPLIPQPI